MVVTAVALLLGAVIGLPPQMTLILGRLISLVIFVTVLLGVIHGRGYLRTFCTGGLVACAYHLLPDVLATRSGSEALLADLAVSLLRQQGRVDVSQDLNMAILALSGTLELAVSVVTLGFFSVWVRNRIERRQADSRRRK